MAKRAAKFSTYDVTRAFTGAPRAGVAIARCEIEQDGRIILVTTEGAALDAPKPKDKSELSPLERWKADEEACKPS